MAKKNKQRKLILIFTTFLASIGVLFISLGSKNNIWVPLNKIEFGDNKPFIKEQTNPITIESIFNKEKRLGDLASEDTITLLATGDLARPVQVAAFRFSKEAKHKIENAKGKAFSIVELMEKNPKGKEVRILG